MLDCQSCSSPKPNQWVLGALSLVVKSLGHEAGYSPPSSTKVTNMTYSSTDELPQIHTDHRNLKADLTYDQHIWTHLRMAKHRVTQWLCSRGTVLPVRTAWRPGLRNFVSP
jgi:hypothetical protein